MLVVNVVVTASAAADDGRLLAVQIPEPEHSVDLEVSAAGRPRRAQQTLDSPPT
jgi:hypothetical protein